MRWKTHHGLPYTGLSPCFIYRLIDSTVISRIFTYRPPAAELDIIFQDDAYIAINKPSGLLSNPGRDPLTHDCALTRLQARFAQIHLVHRLDCDTSGVLVFAKTKAAESALKKQLQYREVLKTYEALVWGLLADPEGLIDWAIGPNPDDRPLQRIDSAGKSALTEYRLIQANAEQHWSRLSLAPKTGRTHQLRVHLNALGHPILGDAFYAHPDALAMRPRLCLHALTFSFLHFATGHRLTLTAPIDF